jgi:hypothetical protein
VLDDKLESLMAELRAIDLWDRMRGDAALREEFGCAGGVEARRRRRREVMDEIDILMNKADLRVRYSPISQSEHYETVLLTPCL